MSQSSVSIIMGRISIATPRSQILVSKTKENAGKLNSVFASTVVSQAKIARGDIDIIGIYDNTMDKHKIKMTLLVEVRDVV